MLAVYLVFLLSFTVHSSGKTVQYYIAAVELPWKHASSGTDLIKSSLRPSNLTINISAISKQLEVYREFEDASFTRQLPREDYLGLLGPVIRASVGDEIHVVFRNMGRHPHSIHPQALRYNKNNEGSLYIGHTPVGGSSVSPGDQYNYTWQVTDEAGPGMFDEECVTSLYYSDVDLVRDVNLGLTGQVIVCRNGVTSSNMKQFFLNFGNFFDPSDTESGHTKTAIQHSTINGFSYGHLPIIEACVGDEILFHMTSLGGSDDVRSVALLGHSFIFKEKRQNSLVLYPGAARTARFQAQDEGKWLLTSQKQEDIMNGMQGIVKIITCNSSMPIIDVTGTIRKYYIAAEFINWNNSSSQRLVFREYTDRTFSTIKTTGREAYMGLLGPLITMETGDIIKVMFFNRADRPLSIHPHGPRVGKPYEGIFYADDNGVKEKVQPDMMKTYYWTVPDYVSPTMMDNPCVPRHYVSGTGIGIDSDLIGPMLICGRGMLNLLNGEKDIFLLFTEKDMDVQEINGYNPDTVSAPTINFCEGDRPKIYVLGAGLRTSQSVTVGGNRITYSGSVRDVIELIDGQFITVTLHTENEGTYDIYNTGNLNVRMPYRVEMCGRSKLPEQFTSSGPKLRIGITDIASWDYLAGANKTVWERKIKDKVRMESTFKKSLYKLYYTSLFTYPIPPYNNYYGPLLIGKTGSYVNIGFKNKATIPFNLKVNGFPFANTTLTKGMTADVKFNISSSMGPGSADHPCIIKMYTSDEHGLRDKATGVIGPLVVCRNDVRDTTIMNKDRHRVIIVGAVDETKSMYIENNVKTFGGNSTNIRLDDPEFVKANTFHTMNGISNTPAQIPRMVTSNVYLHFINFGNKFHTIHIHGHLLLDAATSYVDRGTIALFPGASKTVVAQLKNSGNWLLEEFSTVPQFTRFFGIYQPSLLSIDDGSN